ncbi:MAG TPA: M3 family oligoendopeptidase [Gemmatimonadales bacterium]|nr:M3 family oligoendopeptidase [Gemmatimonadales bacterium]
MTQTSLTLPTLPESPAAFADARWDDILPWYEALAAVPLDADSVGPWLAAWSRLEELVTEAAAEAIIAYTADTRDAEREAAHLRFSAEIYPRLEEQGVRLARRLLATGFARPDLEVVLRRFRSAIEIFRADNLPLFSELEELAARYQRLTGGITVEWDGETRTLAQLSPFLKSPDRSVRERAFRAIGAPYLTLHDELAGLFTDMYERRQRVARNAGFAEFQAYSFAAKCRFDYTPDDVTRFHDAVEAEVVPAVARILEVRRQALGLDALRPWDLDVDPASRPPLRPFQDAQQLMEQASRVFHAVAPDLGAEFDVMRAERLLDLESRAGKAPGGYCETLHFRGRPFIHMNAVGLLDDVNTLLHEAGHSFHAFASHAQPLVWQRHVGAESAELASMSMELLAAPYLAEPGGIASPAELRLARIEHLEEALLTLAHVAAVDAFQRWIYTSGQGGDAAARDLAWGRIRDRFQAGVDWSGLERERLTRWYRQLHIFLYPFYYIEYGLAQLGALQVWRRSRTDQAGAVRDYRAALALGCTVSLPEMYARAGARFGADRRLIGELVRLVEDELARLRGA